MAAKRHARRPSSDDEEESGESGEAAMSAEPKKMLLNRAEQPSPPSPEDAGAQGSGEASPVRSAPSGGAALKTKSSKRVKKPSPASQKEDDASPARGPLPDDTADAGHNKRPATPKPGEKRSPPPQQGEERSEKRAVGPDGEAVAPRRMKKKSKRSADKDRRKRKKKKQIRNALALAKPISPPKLLALGLNDNREDTPSPPQDEHRSHEEEQLEKKMAEQEHVDGTSSAEDNHSVDEEEQQGVGIPQQEQPNNTSPPQEKNRAQEDEEAGVQVNDKAFLVRNAPSTKPLSSETEKKPAVQRSWSYDDELKILNAMVMHAQSHNGALPDSSHLLANLTFDKIDANEDKLTDKIRKLRTRYHKWLLQGCPADDLGCQLFKLSEILWGQVDEDERVAPTSRGFSVLSELYPHLAKEVKEYAKTHSSGDLIMAMFMTIDDEKARDLDAKCKKQQIEAFKLELGQASLTNELLSALQ